MRSLVHQAARLLRQSTYTVALTGAGISTPSGIPDFRSPRAGLWSLADPLEVASIWSFAERPDRFYHWFAPLLQSAMSATPNRAHRILAEMEARGRLAAVITQNFDSMHQAAGSQRVLELHGHARSATCLSCGRQGDAVPLWPTVVNGGPPPRCASCGGLLKPDVVLFGEPVPYETLQEAQQEAFKCDLMLVVGTSLEVMPAADLPLLARRKGALTILITLGPTSLDEQFDVVIHDDLVRALSAVWAEAQDR